VWQIPFRNAIVALIPSKIFQYLKNKHYIKLLESYNIDQEPDLKIVQYLVAPGDTVLDIGANVGVYTKFLSKFVGKDGLVYSIEPVTQTFNILVTIKRALHLDNVEALNYALSDNEGIIQMQIPHYLSGGENYYQARIINENESKENNFRLIEAPATTLDKKFKDIANKISFIKCDIEGHELTCLKGGKVFLKNTNSAWLIEIGGNPDDEMTKAHEVFSIMSENGYTAWWFDGSTLRKRFDSERSVNYFFLLEHHVEKLMKDQPYVFK
jgi:FkbM family methyltransferase